MIDVPVHHDKYLGTSSCVDVCTGLGQRTGHVVLTELDGRESVEIEFRPLAGSAEPSGRLCCCDMIVLA